MSNKLKWYGIVCISSCVLGLVAMFEHEDAIAVISAGLLISATITYAGGEGR